MRRVAVGFLLGALLATPGIAAGPFGGTVRALVLDRAGQAPRWAATDRGLFRAGKDGWRRVEALGQTDLVGVWEGWSRTLAATGHGQLLASEDGGATWNPSATGVKGRFGHRPKKILCLVGDPADRDRVYLGTAGQGLFESRDGGATWASLRVGLEDAPPPAHHAAAVLPAAVGRPLLMGTLGQGVWALEAGRWVPRGEGLPERLRVQQLAAAPDDPLQLLLATRGHGLWRSGDGGQTWKLLRKGAFGVVQAVAAGPGAAALAHFPEEGLVSVTAASVSRPGQLRRARVETLVGTAGGGWLAGLADDGVLEISPAGEPGAFGNQGLDATRVFAVASGAAGNALWCGDANGVFYAPSAGGPWEPRDAGLLGAPAQHLLRVGGELFLGSGGQGVYRWAPDAGVWQSRSGGLGTANTIFSLVADAASQTLYVGTEGGVRRSDDAGGSWQRADAGLPAASRWLAAASTLRPGRVWAAGGGALYRSDDRGEGWQSLEIATDPVALVAVSAGAEERLWVLETGRLFAVVNGLPESAVFRAERGDRLTCLLSGPEGLWVGTARGLWLVAGADTRRVWDRAGVLALFRHGERLWAGTDGRGLVSFRLR